jgi:hypothetical protein
MSMSIGCRSVRLTGELYVLDVELFLVSYDLSCEEELPCCVVVEGWLGRRDVLELCRHGRLVDAEYPREMV